MPAGRKQQERREEERRTRVTRLPEEQDFSPSVPTDQKELSVDFKSNQF